MTNKVKSQRFRDNNPKDRGRNHGEDNPTPLTIATPLITSEGVKDNLSFSRS
jgi:hypothetical protein